MATIDTIADRSSGSAIAGKAYFETSTNKFIVYNGSAWIELDSDGVGAVYENRWGASFDGTNDYVMTSGSPVDMGDMASGYTFSAWVWREDVPSLPSNGGTTSWYGAPYATADTAPNYNTLKWYITDEYWNGGVYKLIRWYHGNNVVNNSSILFPKGVWCHLAVTWDGSNTVTTYLNATQLGQITNASSLTNRADEMLIGKGHFWNKGLVDEVAYWNRGLSSSDITSIYNSGVPDDLSSYSPVGYWRMGDHSSDSATSGGSIATITDSSGNGNDATQITASKQPTFSDLTGESIYA